MLQRTYGTRLPVGVVQDAVLDGYARLFGRAERTLFARLQAGEPLAALKRAFLVRFGLTARQFNALTATLQGKIAGIRAARPRVMRQLERRLRRARAVLRQTPDGTNAYHQKPRRMAILEHRLAQLRADEAGGRVRLCFGSRKLFRRQYALAENGYRSHADWLREWRAARAHQFLVLGSKDETSGCQGCVATVDPQGAVSLRLRLPNALAAEHEQYLRIPDLRFPYGHEAVVAAVGRTRAPNAATREALSWRFLRDAKGWRVLATVSVPPGAQRSVDGIGVVAVDLNATHVAVTDVDRFGNPVGAFSVPCATRGKTRPQAQALIGDAVRQVMTFACAQQKPLVAERLDFERKKAALEGRGRRYARRLSAFAYATFYAVLHARCYDAGIALHPVNPAYTSVIGTSKFMERYGLSRHHAAALCIGRRVMHLSERPNRRLGAHGTVPLPARTRGAHVWAFWRQVARQAAAPRVRGRAGALSRSSPAPAPRSRRGTARRGTRCSSAAGGLPARESVYSAVR